MLSSSTLSHNSPIIFYVDNTLSYLNDDLINSNSKHHEEAPYTSSYYPVPSPFIYNEIENDLDNYLRNHDHALIQQALEANNTSAVTEDSASILEGIASKMYPNKGDEVNGIVEDVEINKMVKKPSACQGVKKRRTSNKDRHSKIRTAHGLRDRRMRLSLEVARHFFKLQDMLGYDKASRTIEWLLSQSKQAIEELLQAKEASPSGVTKCTISSTSDCEVESITVEQRSKAKGKRALACGEKDVKPKQSHKRMRTTKEARKERREEAKKRTLEKEIQRKLVTNKDDDKLSHVHLTNCGAYEVVDGYTGPHSMSPKGSDHLLKVRQDVFDDSFKGVWNSSKFSYQTIGELGQSDKWPKLSVLDFYAKEMYAA